MSEPLDLNLVRGLQIDYGPDSEWDDADVLALAAAYLRLRDEVTDRANVEADLRAQLDQLWPHYTSTYCIHAHHEDCRGTCKVCDEPCLCDCHKAVL